MKKLKFGEVTPLGQGFEIKVLLVELQSLCDYDHPNIMLRLLSELLTAVGNPETFKGAAR